MNKISTHHTRLLKASIKVSLLILLLAFHANSDARNDIQNICSATLKNDTLILQNNVTKHTYLWNNGNIALHKIKNKNGCHLTFPQSEEGDFVLISNMPKADNAKFEQSIKKLSPLDNPYLEVQIQFTVGSINIKRHIKIFPQSLLLSHHFYLKGTNDIRWEILTTENSLEMIEKNTSRNRGETFIGKVPFSNPHWTVKAVQFKEATDHNNNLVQENEYLAYNKPTNINGNVAIGTNPIEKASFIVIKESPLGNSQNGYSGMDFALSTSGLKIFGLGIAPENLKTDSWTRGYGFALGVTENDNLEQLKAIRHYQKSERALLPYRDEMILSNTWGDRSKDSRMNQNFIHEELKAATTIGTTHLQMDDGWQQGLSKNSASKAGLKWDNWSYADWQPHKQRFPNGFDPIVREANEKEVDICLWFNPSKENSYALWERDADILIDYYNQWGIRVFKIDGIDLSNKQSEINLRNLFDKVLTATKGHVVFNLDVTAGQRMGFHYFTEYGNIFLENRYTDWGNYYPYRTLRNLWALSKYVPAEKLQIEFLNPSRNIKKYGPSDPLSPVNIPFDFQVAGTLVAQPLAWMELSQLPKEYFAISELLATYKKHQHNIHKGITLPIGSEPNGFSWTGFQSILNENEGYLLIFRENHLKATQQINTWLPANTRITVTDVFNSNDEFGAVTDGSGNLEIHLSEPFSFRLLHYQIDRNIE